MSMLFANTILQKKVYLPPYFWINREASQVAKNGLVIVTRRENVTTNLILLVITPGYIKEY